MSLLARYTRAPVRNALPVPLVPTRRGLTSAFATGQGKPGEDRTTPMDRLGSVGTLFSVVDRCCTAVASVEWELYDRPADGKVTGGDERTAVTKHPAMDLWRRPNPHMTTSELVHQLTQYRKLVGEWFLLIVRVPGTSVPFEVWPVRPDRMHPVPHPTKFLTGWIYKSPDGEDIPLGVADVIQSKMPNPSDPYRGLGPVQTILTELDASRYTAEWNRNFFLNSAEPGGVIQLPVNLSDPQWEEFTDRWRTQHQGVQNAHRVAVIEYGGEYVPRGYSQRDMEFTALREATRDQVIEAFGISRATLGITDGVNFAAAKAADTQFAKLVTLPELRAVQAALNYRLLPNFYPGKLPSEIPVEFDFESPVGTDSAEEADTLASKIGAVTAMWSLPGVKFDLDALLEAYDLPIVPWQEAAVPLPGQMFGPDGEILPPPPVDPNAPPGGGSAGAGKKQGAPPGGAPSKGKPAPAPGKAPAPAKPKPVPPKSEIDHWSCLDTCAHPVHELANADQAPAWDGAEHDAAWRAALDRLLSQWETVTAHQRAELGRQIATAVDDDNLGLLADLSVDSADAAILLQEALVAVARTAAHQASAEASAQGVNVTPATVDSGHLLEVATATTGLLAVGLALAAGREALRRHDGQKTGTEVASDVTHALAEQGDRPQRDALGAALTGTMNTARVETWRDGPVGSIYASEILDKFTCDPCLNHDGRFVCTTDDLSNYYALYTSLGGYVFCLGRERCRGAVTGAWRPGITKHREHA